jgi:hypothetical protein
MEVVSHEPIDRDINLSPCPTLPESVDSWTDEVESFIKYIEKKCDKCNDEHMVSGYKKKSKHSILALPPIILPAIMSPLAGKFEGEEWMNIITPIAFALVAIASGVATFFNFSKKSEQHFNYSARYGDLSTDIKEQLSKPHNSRLPASVFAISIKTRYNFLNSQGPIH